MTEEHEGKEQSDFLKKKGKKTKSSRRREMDWKLTAGTEVGPLFEVENLEHKGKAGVATEEMGKVRGAAVQGMDSIHRGREVTGRHST